MPFGPELHVQRFFDDLQPFATLPQALLTAYRILPRTYTAQFRAISVSA